MSYCGSKKNAGGMQERKKQLMSEFCSAEKNWNFSGTQAKFLSYLRLNSLKPDRFIEFFDDDLSNVVILLFYVGVCVDVFSFSKNWLFFSVGKQC